MRIDYDYLVNQNYMNFQFYYYFDYIPTDGSAASPTRNYTNLAFQPYALSDATVWCGSVMASHPNAIEHMAGQLIFDFAFDVYFQDPETGILSYSSTEVVRRFQMRSWGEITVDVIRAGGVTQQFSATAVVNNTNPNDIVYSVESATADTDYHNLVSFMGIDVIASSGTCGVVTDSWASNQRGAGVTNSLLYLMQQMQ